MMSSHELIYVTVHAKMIDKLAKSIGQTKQYTVRINYAEIKGGGRAFYPILFLGSSSVWRYIFGIF